MDLARTGEARAVPGQRQSDPVGDAVLSGEQRSGGQRARAEPRPALEGRLVPDPLEAGALDREPEDLLAGDALLQDLAGRGRIADRIDVPGPDLGRAHA